MQKCDIPNDIPDKPGVYFFLGSQKEILYIGKATSLRSRVRSYFADDIVEKRSALIAQMVATAETVEYTETDSVLEALILEANLIRTHKPRFNTRSKDDKSYNHLIITNEEFPRLLVVRGKDLTEHYEEKDIKYTFGPFPHGMLFKEALRIVRKLFQYYDTKKPVTEASSKMERGKIDFNRQIGLYPSEENKEEYIKTIRHIRLLFQGKKKQIIKELNRDMMQLAKAERFEEAIAIRKKVHALTHIQDIALIKKESRFCRDEKTFRIEGYDISHMRGKDMVGVMVVVEHGQPEKSEYRKFKIKTLTDANDPASLTEVLERRLKHDAWPLPELIVVDGATAQKNAVEAVLRAQNISIPVVGVVKDKHHKPKKFIGPGDLITTHRDSILLANAESHRFAITYHKQKRTF